MNIPIISKFMRFRHEDMILDKKCQDEINDILRNLILYLVERVMDNKTSPKAVHEILKNDKVLRHPSYEGMRALGKKVSLHISPIKIYNFVHEILPKSRIDKKICIYLSGFLEDFLLSILDEAVSLAKRHEKNIIDCDILYDTFETKQIFNYIVFAPSDETPPPSE